MYTCCPVLFPQNTFSTPWKTESKKYIYYTNRAENGLWISISMPNFLVLLICKKLNQSECRSQTQNSANQKLGICPQSIRELSLVGSKQGYLKERIKQKIKKSVHSINTEIKRNGFRVVPTQESPVQFIY